MRVIALELRVRSEVEWILKVLVVKVWPGSALLHLHREAPSCPARSVRGREVEPGTRRCEPDANSPDVK